jgi:hypothetical protein
MKVLIINDLRSFLSSEGAVKLRERKEKRERKRSCKRTLKVLSSSYSTYFVYF